MVFSSLTFLLLFLPAVLILYFARSSIKWRNGVLLAASLLFYAWGEPVWILAMLFSTLVNYVCARVIASSRTGSAKKTALTLGVIASIAFLVYFKYAAFLVNSVSGLFGGQPVLPVLKLPIGISFYTFQILTYTVDVYRGKAKVQNNFARLLLYISCFPQLIAGPIVQYADVEDMLTNRTSSPDDLTRGMQRFAAGLGKKVLLANVCGAALDGLPLAGGEGQMSLAGAWLGALLYTMQIYFDFSAYSDMAIGIGRVLGFTYKENFNYPYVSRSVSEFWRRWHISLGSFFRDYVYIPLGGNRVGKGRLIFNLMVVWMLTGFWHGASWNFLAWGLYYGVLIICERMVYPGLMKHMGAVISRIYTMLLVVIGWVLFYYEDIGLCGKHLLAMIGISSGESGLSRLPFIDGQTKYIMKQYCFYFIIPVICCLPVLPWIKDRLAPLYKNRPDYEKLVNGVSACLLTAVLLLSILFLIGQSYNPFIYFRF